jgi:hypothetical protein
MLRRPFHLSDQVIVLLVDGEVSGRRARQARAHVAECGFCRSRLEELESTIADFIALHRSTLDPKLPPSTGSRALLKAHLAEAVAVPPTNSWPHPLGLFRSHRAAAYVCAAVLVTLLGGGSLWRHFQLRGSPSPGVVLASVAIPNHNLTPGATRPVSMEDICSMPHEEVVRAVPSSLRQEVFREYGIVNPRPEDYEIDYLITPGLGGAEDIHNLWPEPKSSSAWNAGAKDALEERLHELVCDGQLDLPTAQRAIATDWITAYKKYLGTDRYVSQIRRLALVENPS